MVSAKVWGWSLAIVVAAFVGYRIDAHARKDALAQVRDSALVAKLDSSVKVGEALKAKFKVETTTVFRRITNTVTRLDTLTRSDTLKLTDTVKVTVEVVREAVETLNACKATVLTCAARADNAESQVTLWKDRYDLLKDNQPGFLKRHLSAGVGYCATVNGGMVLTGPCVSVGLKIWP